jgi:hypothetical protein
LTEVFGSLSQRHSVKTIYLTIYAIRDNTTVRKTGDCLHDWIAVFKTKRRYSKKSSHSPHQERELFISTQHTLQTAVQLNKHYG